MAVVCHGVVKHFYHYTHRTKSLREFFIRTILGRPTHVRRAEFTLRNLELRAKQGESWALIGNNGSGKSTALRLIAGIYEPSEGFVETKGSLAAVIELGVGFNPELTGAENVSLYGSVLGLSRREIIKRFPEIVSFAEVGDFINEPVKYYSSGMKARLAFSVTVSVEPEILLIDEVLAVGDTKFQKRCMDRLYNFRENGGTLIIVSHNFPAVRKLCKRALWLERGSPRMSGEVNEVVDAYLAASK